MNSELKACPCGCGRKMTLGDCIDMQGETHLTLPLKEEYMGDISKEERDKVNSFKKDLNEFHCTPNQDNIDDGKSDLNVDEVLKVIRQCVDIEGNITWHDFMLAQAICNKFSKPKNVEIDREGLAEFLYQYQKNLNCGNNDNVANWSEADIPSRVSFINRADAIITHLTEQGVVKDTNK